MSFAAPPLYAYTEPEHIVRLVAQVACISLETFCIVAALPENYSG